MFIGVVLFRSHPPRVRKVVFQRSLHRQAALATRDFLCGQVSCHKERPQLSALYGAFQRNMQSLSGASEDFRHAATDFLRGLLHPHPWKRMTAQDAVRHPFLTDGFLEIGPDKMPAPVGEEKPTVNPM